MQSVLSRIWTCVAVSISYDDNHYTTGTSLCVCIYMHVYLCMWSMYTWCMCLWVFFLKRKMKLLIEYILNSLWISNWTTGIWNKKITSSRTWTYIQYLKSFSNNVMMPYYKFTKTVILHLSVNIFCIQIYSKLMTSRNTLKLFWSFEME